MDRTSSGDTAFADNIKHLDPLRADPAMALVPDMNATADVDGLAAQLLGLVPVPTDLVGFGHQECLAAMRDIGIFLGSLKRHGVEPVEAVPDVEAVLLELGRRTDMIPRDTVHHYTEWNPVDQRQRMFTGEAPEGHLMDSARLALPHLALGVDQCTRLEELPPTAPEFAETLWELASELGYFDRAISDVLETVTPEFFATRMRPYYEAVTVQGVEYLGPAAAHVPLFVVDLAIWAADEDAEKYQEFIDEAAQHTVSRWRSLAMRWRQRPSAVRRLRTACERASDPESLSEQLRAAYAVLRALTVFRGKHLGIARKAYQDELRLFELGSGGGSIGLLRGILDLTRENATMIKRRGQGGDRA